MIPDFDSWGNLPPGAHTATWPEFVERFGYTAHRQKLMDGLRRAIPLLRYAGCTAVYVDGSFITEKSVPQDFDAVWETVGVDLERLQTLEPVFFQFEDKRAAQKAKFGGEFFPSTIAAGPSGRTFLEFFQMDRNGNEKGIIRIDIKEFDP
jgi:hypothetical protein